MGRVTCINETEVDLLDLVYSSFKYADSAPPLYQANQVAN